MPQPNRPCARCRNWQPPADRRESTHTAYCPLAGRRVAFDETCREWSPAVPTLNKDAQRQAMGIIRRTREGD